MAKYRVLKPIEIGAGLSAKMYFPSDYWGFDKVTRKALPPPSSIAPSGSNGSDIPIDATGIIELPDETAAQLNLGQIAPLDDPDSPNRDGYNVLGKALAGEQKKRLIEDKVGTPEGGEKWESGAPRTVTTLGSEGTLRVG